MISILIEYHPTREWLELTDEPQISFWVKRYLPKWVCHEDETMVIPIDVYQSILVFLSKLQTITPISRPKWIIEKFRQIGIPVIRQGDLSDARLYINNADDDLWKKLSDPTIINS